MVTCSRRIARLISTLAVQFFLVVPPAFPQSAAPPAASTDFVSAINLVLVPVSVNDAPPALFLFDTGLEQSLVDAEYAGQLGLRIENPHDESAPGGTLRVGKVKRGVISIGGLRATALPLQTARLEELSAITGEHIKGIVGYDFIKQFAVRIDYSRKQLSLWAPGTFAYEGNGITLPIHLKDTEAFVSISIKPRGQAVRTATMKLDTGSADVVGFNNNYVHTYHLIAKNQQTLSVSGVAMGGDTEGYLFRLDSCGIGPTMFQNPLVGYTSDSKGFENRADAGTVGGALLSRYTVFLDYSRARVIFEPIDPGNHQLPSDEVGAMLRAEGAALKDILVASVLPTSPAAQAGLRPGDHIVAIDGKTGMSLNAIWERFHDSGRMTIALLRSGVPLSVSVTAKSLIPDQ